MAILLGQASGILGGFARAKSEYSDKTPEQRSRKVQISDIRSIEQGHNAFEMI